MAVPLYQVKAEFFRTLGHPARIRVLELLAEGDTAVRDLLIAARVILTEKHTAPVELVDELSRHPLAHRQVPSQ